MGSLACTHVNGLLTLFPHTLSLQTLCSPVEISTWSLIFCILGANSNLNLFKMTSDDWQTWPASTSASSSPQATMGADSARFGGVPSSAHPAGHAHFRGGPPSGSSGGTVEEEDVKSAEEGLSSSARSEESETRYGKHSCRNFDRDADYL